jgi:hypothetical protein
MAGEATTSADSRAAMTAKKYGSRLRERTTFIKNSS